MTGAPDLESVKAMLLGAFPRLREHICDCEFDPRHADDGDDSWHFHRECKRCGEEWAGLHCPHDGHQNRCPGCGVNPTPALEIMGLEEFEAGAATVSAWFAAQNPAQTAQESCALAITETLRISDIT